MKKLIQMALATLSLSMFCLIAFSQGRQTTGIIVDETGESEIGANVLGHYLGLMIEERQQLFLQRPRILISTDIGGTDPDDNQSMAHFLMYCNEFDTEGLISSPSYGSGSQEEILRMIDLYEQDLPKLKKHATRWPEPDYLRSITKQGRKGSAPYCGYSTATEGSEWIVECARRADERPLWVLVWGGLDDLAQALHDAPDIADKIRVYWIGGPNKKWSINSYAYIVEHFPHVWFIRTMLHIAVSFVNLKITISITWDITKITSREPDCWGLILPLTTKVIPNWEIPLRFSI